MGISSKFRLILLTISIIGSIQISESLRERKKFGDEEIGGEKSKSAARQITRSSFNFLLNYYQTVRKAHTEDVIISPFSLRMALAMLKLGAHGETNEELKQGLNFPFEDDVLMDGYLDLIKHFEKNKKDYILEMANKIYPQEGYKLQENFEHHLKDYFKTDVEALDFKKGEESAKKINQWVEQKTHEKIKDVIAPSDLSRLTRLVLANAVYFNATWATQFDPVKTKSLPFFTEPKKPKDVLMMANEGYYSYAKFDDYAALAMPYQSEKIEMIILLPDEGKTLKELEDQLKGIKLDKIEFGEVNIKVFIPKFKIETKVDLKTPLSEMGMPNIFDPAKADFGGIGQLADCEKDCKDNLYVSKAIQKCFIEVHEVGTEAGAVTVLAVSGRSVGFVKPTEFNANRPFFFYIWCRQTKTVLFAGAVVKPKY